MNNQNITKVYLLRVPLENDYKNTLYFANAQAQQTYFQSKIAKSYTDFSYQRKDNIIRIPDIYDNIYNCNYVMYQNSAYSNKWFYAFIDEMTYISDGRTDITIETDVIQTWLFDYDVKSSFVEREHVSNDTLGANTIPENVELGEYVISEHVKDSNLTITKFVLSSTVAPSDIVTLYGGKYNGIFCGPKYYPGTATRIKEHLQALDNHSKADAVDSIFMAPTNICDDVGGIVPDSDAPVQWQKEINPITQLDGYTPTNNKLLTFPYCFINMSNSNGSNAIYHQELFTRSGNNKLRFQIDACLTPGCSIRCYPIYYRNETLPYDESLVLGKYPQCSWATDTYTNWLTQNAVNIGLGVAESGISIVGGAATSNPMAVVGGISGIANTIAQVYQHSLIPPQTRGNTNSGDVVAASLNNTFHWFNTTIKSEYARIIDGYFNMFGYKVNAVKVPNKAHRSNYWYTKCIDVSIDGNIPQNDMKKIKDCYNNGIRFWRNASNIEDYSVSNGIV